jgi:hypothetical protein
MGTACIAQLIFQCQGLRSPSVARRDMPHTSSDGGLVLLKAVDERLRPTETVAAGLTDSRQAGKVAHSLLDLVRQRCLAWSRGTSTATTPLAAMPTLRPERDRHDRHSAVRKPVGSQLGAASFHSSGRVGSPPSLARAGLTARP